MPKLPNNLTSSASTLNYRRSLNNNNNMKREFVFPLIVGLIFGALVMIFWQFNARLNNAGAVLTQLEQATAQNTKNVGDIITFINNATGQKGAAQTGAPAAETTNK